MEFEEFKEYVEKNCNAKETFFTKMTEYFFLQMNQKESTIVLTESQIDREVKKAWNTSLKRMYDGISKKVTTKRSDPHEVKVEKWIDKMNELEVLDSFTEELDSMEFE